MPRKYSSLADRLIANTVLSRDSFHGGTPCWEWIGAYVINRSGKRYGKLKVRLRRGRRKGQHRTWYAHRLAVVVFKGVSLWARQKVLHLCSNTICINPAHLIGGSQRKNVRQCVKEGRHKTPWRRTGGERYAGATAI